MLSTARIKELLNTATMSDEEVEEIRDGFRALAEIIFEQWREERLKNRDGKNQS